MINPNSSIVATDATIRLARITDIPEMMQIANSAKTASQWTEDRYREVFAETLPQRIAIVAEQKSVLKGFLVARALAGEWEIENIIVSASERRLGLATMLLKELIKIVLETAPTTIYLEVRESNLAARYFYEKHGFQQNGRRNDYYHEPTEAAVLYQMAMS